MTRFFAYAGEALSALMRNKARAILTILGIFIGVGAVDAVYALSTGAAAAINSSVSTGDQPSLTIYADPQQGDLTQAQPRYRDAQLIADQSNGTMRRVIPQYSVFYNNQRIYNIRQGSANKKVAALGFSWYGDDSNFAVADGRTLTTRDVEHARTVVVVSPKLAEKFFGSDEAAPGNSLTINGTRFQIIGVADSTTGTASNYFGGSYYIVMPYTTYHQFAPGNVDAVQIWTDSPQDEDAAKAAALATLKHEHGGRAKYIVQSTREQEAQFNKVLNIVAIGLTAIGGISLLVAGIGIMNIMLVSVSERTREIGIRKAIGARAGEIVLQFLLEAVLLSLAGGGLGLGLAVAIIAGASGFLASKFGSFVVPYASIVLIAFVFSLSVGLVFGVYPAMRASRLEPVEALRS